MSSAMMKLLSMVPFRIAILGLILLAGTVSGISQEYCSNENTGSGYSVGEQDAAVYRSELVLMENSQQHLQLQWRLS